VVACIGDAVDDCVLVFEGGCKLVLIGEVVDPDDGGVWGKDGGGGEAGDDCYREVVASERVQDVGS
jgi:hypothetical protein